MQQRTRRSRTPHVLTFSQIGLAALMAAAPAHAFQFDTGNDDWSIRWDNTLKASTIYRLKNADPALVNTFRDPANPGSGPQAANFNAGNDNFRNQGFVSRRLDWLSDLDIVYQRSFGARVSGAAWYDQAYSGTTDAQDRFNGQNPYNEFTDYTKKLAGRKAELLDAFVFGGWSLGSGMKLTGRLGRHALQYGETVFFGDNGIARAQGPVDIMKLLGTPNAQFKEIIRPVNQVSTQLQINSSLSVGGYYQFAWEADRLAPGGSYFSSANPAWGGSTYAQVVNGLVTLPGGDRKPSDFGQFGLQAKMRFDETDVGLYAARYHDKSGQLYTRTVAAPVPGSYHYVFPSGVKTVGLSATRSFGDTNLAFEASTRYNQPLVNANMVFGVIGPPFQPDYATGHTGHVNVSWLTLLPPSFLAREASIIGEIAWNRAFSVHHPAELDARTTRSAIAAQMIFTPSYRQVISGLDLSVPIGVRYAVKGNSSITGIGWGAQDTGSATIGLEGAYNSVWQFGLNYTHYIGRAIPFVDYAAGLPPPYGSGNPLADRDNLSLNLRRTF